MPPDVPHAELFGFGEAGDVGIGGLGWCEAAFVPAFETKVLENRGEHELVRDSAGRHVLCFKGRRNGFMPEYVDHPVKDMKILVSSYLATLITSSTLFSGYWLLFSSVTILMTDDYDLKFGNADFSNLYPATRFRPRPRARARAQSQNFIEYEDEYDDDKVGRATVPADIRASPTAE